MGVGDCVEDGQRQSTPIVVDQYGVTELHETRVMIVEPRSANEEGRRISSRQRVLTVDREAAFGGGDALSYDPCRCE